MARLFEFDLRVDVGSGDRFDRPARVNYHRTHWEDFPDAARPHRWKSRRYRRAKRDGQGQRP